MSLHNLWWVSMTVAALTLSGCTPRKFSEPICQPSSATKTDRKSATFASSYFPAKFGEPTLDCGYPAGPRPIISDLEREWYSRQLRAASEPSLYEATKCAALPDFALRFSYIPSFHPSAFIRVQSDGEGFKLIAKELTGAGGYDPGVLGRSKELRLTKQQSIELQKMLAIDGLFEERPKTCGIGFDGSQWIFEMVDKDGYRMVDRWSPRDGAAHRLGMHLIELSGLKVDTY